MGRRNKNTLRRIKIVCDIVQKHYEPGNYAKSYFKVWKQYVDPVYPCCYRTLLKYVNTPLGDLNKPPKNQGQLNLFDDQADF